jgi:HSP90 family molecular chaperone
MIMVLGAVDETTAIDDQNISPGELRRRKNRARYAAMSPLQKEALNKKRRDARAAKRLFKTPQEKKVNARLSKCNYKKKMKEQREKNLHPDSITMANPQWKLELIFREPPQQDETLETFLSNTMHTAHLTPGLRESR